MITANTAEMGAILRCVQSIVAPLKKLTILPLHLKIIGVLTRIEGGGLLDHDVNIDGLSKDIERLAEEVDGRLSYLFDGASDLSLLLRERVADLAQHAHDERNRAGDLCLRVESILQPSLERLTALEAEAARLNKRFLKFQRATDSVVISLQSEDIARQRLEHVQEAIRRAGSALESGEDIARVGAILTLQRAQLESTRSIVERALETIHGGLQDLAPVVHELIAQSSEQARQAEASSRSCTDDITLEVPRMLKVFQQCSQSVRAVRELLDSVYPSVHAMTNGADELGQVAYSIQLLSFNTSVKTVHLGDRGAPLGVLARELQTVIDASASDTAEVLRGLSSIADTLTRMKQESSTFDGLLLFQAAQDVGLEALLEGPAAQARACGTETNGSLGLIRGWANSLSEGIAQGIALAADSMLVLRLFDEQLVQMDAAFASFGYTPGPMTAHDAGQPATGLADLYSMASERELHAAILGQETVSAGSMESPTSEFGDSVELF
jgi:hypothetical protein